MKPIIALSRSELQKHPHADAKLSALAEKIAETNTLNIYIIHDSEAFVDLFCFLRDEQVLFTYGSEEEVDFLVSSSVK
jgi:hypothetical protein